ncbi:WD repeat-containing protein 89 [Aphis gossypii]|uniref:WD repeat-containing protein 89 n=1 Tax=Aphis gossypii TaxID=80765 RepID=UPI002158E6E4|nr:WD repeat-containing protein 89 [Aphis gossypii]
MTLQFITDTDSSDSSSENGENSGNSSFNDEDSLDEDEVIDIHEEPVFDSSKEIHYKVKYKQTFEESISSNEDDEIYVLNLDAQKSGQTLRVATALSNFTCNVYDIDAGVKSNTTYLKHEKKIVDVKFGSSSTQLSSIVYTGSEDGTIKLWDLRLKEKCVSVFKDDTDAELKPLSCFDVSCDGRFLVAGTEVFKDDAFLLFWDIRTSNLLGGYWDTHQEDITQVKFHPTEDKTVISGSTDGIINLFDVTQTTEQDALQSSFNTNSSIALLSWFKNKNDDSIISCVTHTEDVQLWHTTDSSPYSIIPRETISSSMNIKPDLFSQIINCHQTNENGNIMLLVGNDNSRGEHLQSLDIINDGPELSPRTLFKNNKQIVRCSWYDYKCGIMVTGGEAGILNVWVPSDDENNSVDNTGKCTLKELPKVSLKNHSSKPY